MMTKTQFTDARRNIRRQLIPWISIVVIGMVALIAYLYVSRQNREAQQRAERAKARAAKKAEPEIEPFSGLGHS